MGQRKRNDHVSNLRNNCVKTLCQINVKKLRNKIMPMDSKSNAVVTFGNYVRITLQKFLYNYVERFVKFMSKKLRNKTMQMRTKKYVIS